jgi:hypothetical protein
MDPVRQIADAVLYEGYILWPYRRSATKNQRRWTFGGVYPRAHSEGRDDDPWVMQTQCLLEADDGAKLEARIRFLHVIERQVTEESETGPRLVDELTVGDRRYLTWEEAVEREVVTTGLDAARLRTGVRVEVRIPAGEEREELRNAEGRRVGAIVRTWHGLEGAVELRGDRLGPRLMRVTARITNTTPCHGEAREEVLKRTFCSTHTMLQVNEGAFVSQTDPPPELRQEVEACGNQGTWPVLVGEPGERRTVLSSPIILEDHPRIAPESPGDLFDGGEIDQLLTLNILSLTDEEKAEMRDSDPRAREILERTEALSEEELMRLHGAIREFGMVRER